MLIDLKREKNIETSVFEHCLPHNGDLLSARSHTTKSASAPPAETTRASEGDTATATTEAWCRRWRPISVRVAVSQMITRTFNQWE